MMIKLPSPEEMREAASKIRRLSAQNTGRPIVPNTSRLNEKLEVLQNRLTQAGPTSHIIVGSALKAMYDPEAKAPIGDEELKEDILRQATQKLPNFLVSLYDAASLTNIGDTPKTLLLTAIKNVILEAYCKDTALASHMDVSPENRQFPKLPQVDQKASERIITKIANDADLRVATGLVRKEEADMPARTKRTEIPALRLPNGAPRPGHSR